MREKERKTGKKEGEMIVMGVERYRKMKKWGTIGLDGVIQMTRETAEGWKREGEETGGDGSLRPLSASPAVKDNETFSQSVS